MLRTLLRSADAHPRLASVAVCAPLLVGLALAGSLASRQSDRAPRVGSLNIRRLGVDATDYARLAAVLRESDADVFAVQEVMEPAALARVARDIGYAHIVAECGGSSRMRVGFLYRTERASVEAQREYRELDRAGKGSCKDGQRSGLAVRFNVRGESVWLLNVHLSAMSDPERYAKRREQWRRIYDIVTHELSGRALILGDTNSTGYLDDANGERTFVDEQARAHGMTVETQGIQCSEYWRTGARTWSPSLLDHVVSAPQTVLAGSARVHGYCAQLACREHSGTEAPSDWTHVSDHCPVTVALASSR